MVDELQDLVGKEINPEESRVWLACMRGRRLDVMWAIGEVRTDPYEKLTRMGPYLLMGQHVEGVSKDRLVGIFETHMEENTFAQRA